MTDCIILPRAWLEQQITSQTDFLRAAIYLAKEINEHGSVNFSSGDANMMFGMSPRRYRTFMQIIANDKQTDKQTTNKTTNITFDCQVVTTTKRQARRQTNDKQTDKQTDKQKRLTKSSPDYVSPPFVSPEYADTWRKFIEYRKEINKPYKSEASERIAYNKMVEMSGNNPETAKDMVERTILGQWQGLFPKDNGTTNTTRDTAVSRKAQRDRGLSLANEIVSRSENLLSLYNGCGTDADNR